MCKSYQDIELENKNAEYALLIACSDAKKEIFIQKHPQQSTSTASLYLKLLHH